MTIRVVLVALACSMFGTTAFAMPMLFDINGTFADGSVLTGTMTIDPVAGLATAVNLNVGPPTSLAFNVLEAQAQVGPSSYQLQTGLATTLPDLNIILPVSTLVGYVGGHVCSVTQTSGCNFASDIFFSPRNTRFLATGAVTTAVPEPATLVLLGTGLLGAVVRLRRARASETPSPGIASAVRHAARKVGRLNANLGESCCDTSERCARLPRATPAGRDEPVVLRDGLLGPSAPLGVTSDRHRPAWPR